ncbi:MAG: GGDEF domain-containing phosphodiesterase, partial [Moraxellaceae bacterium]
TASAGLVDITYTSENDANILRAAEEACAQAKAAGGNRIQVYQPDSEELTRRDNVMVWVAKLNQALEQERLTLRCQRIQAIHPERFRDELPHYEILLGMRDDGGEDLPPSEFVQAAERYNRMLAVDRWVVDSALHWLKDNPEKFARIGMVSINLSGHSLSDAKMMSYLFDRLLEYGLPPEKICFEITETTAISNLPDAVDFMREMRKAGCRFALDDFGAGHATYNYLKHLPLDFVKIDGAFVKDIATDENDFAMVRSINDLAHYMGIQTIAEYVEDDAILARLSEIGVDYAQGYGIERPRWLDSL